MESANDMLMLVSNIFWNDHFEIGPQSLLFFSLPFNDDYYILLKSHDCNLSLKLYNGVHGSGLSASAYRLLF